MEEADDEDDGDGEEDEAHGLEGDQFLQLHVVLVDGAAVVLLLLDGLEHLVDAVDHLVDHLAVLLLGQRTQIGQLRRPVCTSSPWKKLKVKCASRSSRFLTQK